MKLTPKLIRKLVPDRDSKQVECVDASKQGLMQLKWLSASGNALVDLAAVHALSNLRVLNLSFCSLSGALDVAALTSLRALILNDNALEAVTGLGELPQLNTLVLTRNRLAELGAATLAGCSALAKLSLSHNPLADLEGCLDGLPALNELRLNDCRVAALPSGLAASQRLRILDLGHNPIRRGEDLQVLARLPWLRSLNLVACPLASFPHYMATLHRLVPDLQVLDGRRVAERGGGRHVAPGR
ncbi:hypothetical protein WJX81_004018 [Elliptochloris bilobata]|uniref:Uncharacterized protein n=1 Tax=Elliptochloris bilobata TaxID=381761 RepID=A0AAW1RT81_9CHLO